MMDLRLKTDLDPVALLALIVSLGSLGFSMYQWFRAGFRLSVHAFGDLISIPDDGYGRKIRVALANVGGKKAQINQVTFSAGNFRYSRGLLPTNPFPLQPPFVLDVGEERTIYFHQDRLIEEAGRAHLQCNVWVSFRKTPIVARVKFTGKKSP